MTLRPILFLHRWLGILVGVIMTVWCLSGFVMIYSPYPRLQPAEQVRGLMPLRLPAGTNWGAIDLAGDTLLSSARVERMGERLVLRIMPAHDAARPIAQMRATAQTFDVLSGRPAPPVPREEALKIGQSFGARFGGGTKALAASPVGIDQWTVQTARRHQPLWRIDYADGASAYVAGSGEVVQQTTRAERFWGWLGAVPHWLYPTLLRQNGELWLQVVVWSSLLGCFLTVTGLWVGIARLRRNREGRVASPYRGLWWWHHMGGLFFGVLTLTWVASGLVSMNPWGLLASESGFAERDRLSGALRWGDARAALANLGALPPGTVRIEAAPLGGTAYLALVAADGHRSRLGIDGRPAPLTGRELSAALAGGPPLASLELLRTQDAYYYAHHGDVSLPVWRAVIADGQATRLYIDPVTGRLIRSFDANGRRFRWLMNGLHSLDLPGLRARPLWDALVLPLLAMVTLVCATGTWMGIAKVRRDMRRTRNRRRRRARLRATVSQGVTP